MTLRDWLADREPVPPRILRERVEALALEIPDQDGETPDQLLAAAEAALERMAREGTDDRAAALDLLAVDALVTYAFEFAAQSPDGIPRLSERAMTRLSAVGAR